MISSADNYLPGDIVTNASGCSQVVNFTAAATDSCGVTNLACVPPSGTSFALGITPVTCVAADRHPPPGGLREGI